jgi:hypothetical protein
MPPASAAFILVVTVLSAALYVTTRSQRILASVGASAGPASPGVDLCDGPWIVGIGPHNAPDFDHVDANGNERDGEDESGNSPAG